MCVELSGRLVVGKGARVVLWYCEACGRAEHEVRPAFQLRTDVDRSRRCKEPTRRVTRSLGAF